MSATTLAGGEIVGRRPFPYRTSFPIEELEVELPGGGRTSIVCKRLDREGLDATARLAKPLFLHASEREIHVYERLLPRGPAGPPRFLDAQFDRSRTLLFIERIEGRPLAEVGERRLWEEAAGWLGRFHAAFEDAADEPEVAGCLVDHDADFHRFWLVRARGFAAAARGTGPALDWLDARHGQVVEALSGMDRTLLHGEFYASNVLIAEERSIRVAPVDWELAGPGPGALDLAALVCGWPPADRDAMRRAYGVGRGRTLAARDLDLARLQIAIQWLGWAPPEWKPPPTQRRDWAAEAVEIAEELGL